MVELWGVLILEISAIILERSVYKFGKDKLCIQLLVSLQKCPPPPNNPHFIIDDMCIHIPIEINVYDRKIFE